MEIEDYASKLRRNIFPCSIEREVMHNFSEACVQARFINEQDSAHVFCEGKDTVFMYQASKKEWTVINQENAMNFYCNMRDILLLTLNHGSIRIKVHNLLWECSNIVLYDGLSDGVLCIKRKHAISRELLDAWMFDACGIGMLF